MSIAKRLVLIFSVLVCCAGCDRVSKRYAEARLSQTQTLSFLAGAIRLQLARNEGAFLGLGASLSRPARQAIFRTGVACMLLGLLAYALFFAPGPWSVSAASLILAGGASNLADRFVYDGYVLDFINLGVGPLRTGIFNLADVAITAGVVMLMIGGRRARRQRTRTSP
jgi:signal peptidase II